LDSRLQWTTQGKLLFMNKLYMLLMLLIAGLMAYGDVTQATIKVNYQDPVVSVNGLGGGRFMSEFTVGSLIFDNDVYCIDFAHNFGGYGVSWAVDLVTLDDANFANEVRYGNIANSNWHYNFATVANAQQRYMMASWLTLQYEQFFDIVFPAGTANKSMPSDATSGSYTAAQRTAIKQAQGVQSAIWNILDPTWSPDAPSPIANSGGTTYRNQWLTAAYDKIVNPATKDANWDQATDKNYDGFRVVSARTWKSVDSHGVRNDPPQEFITIVPEPAAFLLLGSFFGLASLVTALKRNKA